MNGRCPYRTLELEPGAPFPEVRRAYERVRSIFGASSLAVYSLVSPEEQRAVLHEIEDAYRVLSDPELRAAYDRAHGHPTVDPTAAEEEATPAPRLEVVPAAQEIEPAPEPGVVAAEEAEPEPEPETVVATVEAEPAPEPEAPPAPRMAPRTTPPPLPVQIEAPEVELPPITEETVFSGELLRQVRMARNLPIREIADRTKISPTHLESIELERWDWLPARVFLRGFLVSLARELRLDPEQVSRTFLARRDS